MKRFRLGSCHKALAGEARVQCHFAKEVMEVSDVWLSVVREDVEENEYMYVQALAIRGGYVVLLNLTARHRMATSELLVGESSI